MKCPNNRKILFLVAAFFIFLSTARAATNYNYYLEKGISDLNDSYDSESARKNFKKIINAPLASERVKVRAYFWTAYCDIFDGNKDGASAVFRDMFNFKNDISYRYESGIDEVLINNGELMRLYDLEYKKFFKKEVDAKRISIIENPNQMPQQKNYVTRLAILGSIGVIALIVSFL